MAEAGKPTTRPAAILVATDFSSPADRALDLALAWHGGSDVTLLHVIDAEFAARVDREGIAVRPAVVAKLRAHAEMLMARRQETARPVTVEAMVVEGTPFVEIVKIARDLEVDAIVMGMRSTDRRIGDLLAGNTAEMVLRASPCPVIAVP